MKNINVSENSRYQGLKTQRNCKWDFQHNSTYSMVFESSIFKNMVNWKLMSENSITRKLFGIWLNNFVLKPFEIKNLVQNENILQEKRQLLWNMVDPNVKRELQPECVVPSVKKKTSIEKSTFIPSLVKKKLQLTLSNSFCIPVCICTLFTKCTFNASNIWQKKWIIYQNTKMFII